MTHGFAHERARSDEMDGNTWLTPPELLRALGDFDLDPCACKEPRPWPTARRHISWPEDGLFAPWEGRVWCNPPYGPHTGHWIKRLAEHGNGTALIFARTETDVWQKHVWPKATAILFLKGRVRFCRPDGTRGESASAPSALVAFGLGNANSLATCGMGGALIYPGARLGLAEVIT